jgi:hypothetical protein
MNYEVQIFAKDKTKFIRFQDDERADFYKSRMTAWEDFYYALGSVIDDKAEKIRKDDTLIARLEVKQIYFDEVIDIMCEDLTPDLVKLLTEEQEISVLV